jgi:O-antigen/teichoic acid export membrane protein
VTPNLVRPDEIPGARMCFALIPTYGASGAAVASSIGYAAGALAAWLIFERLARAEPKTR